MVREGKAGPRDRDRRHRHRGEASARRRVLGAPGKRWPGAFENCAEAQARGRAPVRKGEQGYAPWLDADGDGTGCDAG
ncbi:hypothetical protein F0344_05105 [Streptomyces finlayi]|uniref:Excalibur calcium-binding domain-containing protein n=1 Tax=Streptomyces finlayi TaxID=67296 RepID=A0A7G7BFE9_9ACTN|nr:excalibur calcium-binding domain-containing protein [Streptomyces finlayi]QNE74064.1 hypothetical protein F0344_05105 [Streptomyces finlayi]